MPVQVICKSHKDQIKTKKAMLRFWHSRVSNFIVYSPMWPDFEFVRDFMAVLVTCKFKMIQSKIKALSSGQHFPHYKFM